MGVIRNMIRTTMSDPEIMQALGKRLRALRKARRLTVVQAAERAALSRDTVANAEAGRNPTLETLIRLLRVYGGLGGVDLLIPAQEVSPLKAVQELRSTRG